MITAARLRSVVVAARVPLVLALVVVVLALAGEGPRRWLAFDRVALEQGAWWRLLGAHLVHLGPYHTALNLLGLLALSLLCPQALGTREWLRRLLLLGLATSAMLYAFAPQVDRYVGFSGVLHGLFLLGLLPQALARDRVALACLLYLGGKLAWEQLIGTPIADEIAIGGRVVTEAHLFGTLAALAYAATFKSIFTGVKQK